MDKEIRLGDVKSFCYELSDLLDKKVGELMANRTDSEETGEVRAKVYTELMSLQDHLKEIANNI